MLLLGSPVGIKFLTPDLPGHNLYLRWHNILCLGFSPDSRIGRRAQCAPEVAEGSIWSSIWGLGEPMRWLDLGGHCPFYYGQ